MKAQVVAVVALLAVACHVGAAIPDDEQVLVQRAAVVQQDGLDVHQPGKNLLQERADSSTAPVKELLQKQAHISVGKEGAICTPGEMQEFQSKQEAYVKLERRLSEQFKQDVYNVSKTILDKHMEPLKQASKRVEEAATPVLKPIIRDIIKYYLVQIYKPSKAYDLPSVVKDLNQSMDAFQNALMSQRLQAIWTEAFSTFDSLLNQTEQALPEPDHLAKSKFVRMSPAEMNMSDISEYFAFKVMPLIAVEIFPSLAKPIKVIGQYPEDQAAFSIWLVSEAMPAFMQAQKEWGELMEKYKPTKEEMPVRLCSTCEEKHAADVNSPTTGCAAGCFGILTTCASGINSNCVSAGSQCIKCFNKHSAALDECTGNATHAKEIASWELVAKALDNATTPEGVDSMLDNISHMILDQ